MRRRLAVLLSSSCLLFAVKADGHAARTSLTTTTFLWISPAPPSVDGLFSVAFGDAPAFPLRRAMDRDGDGQISNEEQASFTAQLRERLSSCLSFRIDGAEVRPILSDRGTVLDDRAVAPTWLRVDFDLSLTCPERAELEVRDGCDFPARGDAEIRLEPPPGVAISKVRPEPDRNGESLSLLLRTTASESRTFAFSFDTLPERARIERRLQSPTLATPSPNPLVRLLPEGELISLWAALMAFVLGALHALSPGHGKTLVAAYLVGEKGTARHAIALGLVVTLTHVASVIVLGLAALWASETLLPQELSSMLSAISGVMITLIGASMLRARILGSVRANHHDHAHEHGAGHHRELRHEHDPELHHGVHQNGHGHDQHDTEDHHHLHPNYGIWKVLTLGISGGLVPCPTAMVALLLAIAAGRIAEGMVLIIAFSAGLATVLVAIGLLVVHAKALIDRLVTRKRAFEIIPMVSAALVTCIGVAVLVQALLGG